MSDYSGFKERRKTSNRPLDAFVVLFCLAGAACSLYLFYKDLYVSFRSPSETQAGTVVVRQNVVHRRLNDRLVWDRLFTDTPVYNGDVIRVARLSGAELNVDDSRIDLGENTLIRIQKDDDLFKIDFFSGDININSNSKGTPVLLSIGESVIEASPGAVLSASSGDNGAVLRITEGKAYIIQDGKVSAGLTASPDKEIIIMQEKANGRLETVSAQEAQKRQEEIQAQRQELRQELQREAEIEMAAAPAPAVSPAEVAATTPAVTPAPEPEPVFVVQEEPAIPAAAPAAAEVAATTPAVTPAPKPAPAVAAKPAPAPAPTPAPKPAPAAAAKPAAKPAEVAAVSPAATPTPAPSAASGAAQLPAQNMKPLLSAPQNMLPANGYRLDAEQIRQSKNIIFSWSAVEGANAYILTILKENTLHPERVFQTEISDNASKYTFDNFRLLGDNGAYIWQLEAISYNSDDIIDRRGRTGESKFTVDVPRPGRVRVKEMGILYGTE